MGCVAYMRLMCHAIGLYFPNLEHYFTCYVHRKIYLYTILNHMMPKTAAQPRYPMNSASILLLFLFSDPVCLFHVTP